MCFCKLLSAEVKHEITYRNQGDVDLSGSSRSNSSVVSGYSLSNALYEMLCVRYASKDFTINMDDFVLLSVRLEAMFSEFCQEFLFMATVLFHLEITWQRNIRVSVAGTSQSNGSLSAKIATSAYSFCEFDAFLVFMKSRLIFTFTVDFGAESDSENCNLCAAAFCPKFYPNEKPALLTLYAIKRPAANWVKRAMPVLSCRVN